MSSAAAPAVRARHLVAAWGVHALTMTGIVWALLATIALFHGDLVAMWGWLGVALVVDGLDGTLARRAKVSERIPWFDGVVLDMVVDYLTWTFIPALFMYLYLPWGPRPMSLVMLVVICVSSLFCYCNKQMKSSDHYFVGFPAAWNVVAVYMWLLETPAVVNIIATLVLAVLTMAPVVFLHPFRVRRLMAVNVLAVAGWLATTIWLVVNHPERPVWVQVLWWVCGGWFGLISAWRTYRGRADR